MREFDHRRREDRRDARVDRVTAVLEDAHAGFDRERLPSGDDAAPSPDYRPKRIGSGNTQSRTEDRE